METTKFTIEKCTASVNGGYVCTMRSKGAEQTIDGIKFINKGMKRFTKVAEEVAIGKVIDIPLDRFNEVRIEGVYQDPDTNEERPYTNVWLMFKG